MTITTPTALVVYESMFGNTRQVAHAVAAGIELEGFAVSLAEVGEAPDELPHVDLLAVGAPTHAFSLSRPSTRADAVRQGAPASHARTGLREWLTDVSIPATTDTPVVAVFDTRVSKVRHLPKAASARAARMVRRDGLMLVSRPASFLVDDVTGPLLDGELERAAAWGRSVAGDCRNHAASRQAHEASAPS